MAAGNYPVGRAWTGEDHTGEIRDAHVHRRDGHNFGLVQSERFLQFTPEFHPFLNPANGNAMNQNVTFGGTQEIIHNGGTSTEWTGSAISGTWNFADGGRVSITTANDQDAATFAEETPTTIDISGFVVLTGDITLTTYNAASNTIEIFWDNAGAQIGDTLLLSDFIDTSLIGTNQNFAIATSLFNFPSSTVDGFTITITRTGAAKPTMSFDDITLQQTGTPLEYKATTPLGTRFHVTGIQITLADVVTLPLDSLDMPRLSFQAIMNINALTDGIVFRYVQEGKTSFSVIIKQLGDFLATGANINNAISFGTTAMITLLLEFPEPIILEGGESENFLSFIINDNLSGLVQFTAVARGAIEI